MLRGMTHLLRPASVKMSTKAFAGPESVSCGPCLPALEADWLKYKAHALAAESRLDMPLLA